MHFPPFRFRVHPWHNNNVGIFCWLMNASFYLYRSFLKPFDSRKITASLTGPIPGSRSTLDLVARFQGFTTVSASSFCLCCFSFGFNGNVPSLDHPTRALTKGQASFQYQSWAGVFVQIRAVSCNQGNDRPSYFDEIKPNDHHPKTDGNGNLDGQRQDAIVSPQL